MGRDAFYLNNFSYVMMKRIKMVKIMSGYIYLIVCIYAMVHSLVYNTALGSMGWWNCSYSCSIHPFLHEHLVHAHEMDEPMEAFWSFGEISSVHPICVCRGVRCIWFERRHVYVVEHRLHRRHVHLADHQSTTGRLAFGCSLTLVHIHIMQMIFC